MMPTRLALLVLTLASFAVEARPQDASDRRLAPILASSPEHGLPGAAPATERWIVHFDKRTFDLEAFRAAVRTRRPAAEVATIVRGLEAAVQLEQRGFVDAVQQLGGRVDQQWWLINAAVAEIAPAKLDALRELPGVAYVEADQVCEPVIRRSTSSLNHNADALHAQGFKGLGVAVGVVDTGHDENVGGTGRPHRTYFVNGDPANSSGGGIGGSRLLVNRQIGTQPADDVNGHGTGVDSIAAGADWGLGTVSDDGHAPMAGIAGYAVSNNTSGSSSIAVLASAWQALTADVSTFHIVAANMSYSSSNDALSADAQAMDSAALNGDVLYCVAAGNSGSTVFSSPAVNGLAVAAVMPDTHVVASFSSRGPMQTDPQRTYPDIAGCGVGTVMAARDNESGTFVANGTSMASPQVAGAAVQLRARFPNLTAIECKAVLLASTLDISAANPAADRNAYGMGLLRNDRAHDLVQAGNVGTGQVTSAAPHTFAMPVFAGRSYQVAIAWHRQNVGLVSWSNLELEALDPASTVLAASLSPRNLYEMLRFTSPVTGTLTIRTRGTSFELGNQATFGFAWTEVPGPPLPGTLSMFGSGCAPVCDGINQGGGVLAGTSQSSAREFAYDLSTTGPMTLTGFEVFANSTTGGNVSLIAIVYGSLGGTIDTRLGITSFTLGSAPGFYRATFSTPINLPGGPFWISLYHSNTSNLSDLLSGTSVGAYERPGLLNGTWTRSALTVRPAFRFHCALPNGGSQPVLNGSPAPHLGASTTFTVTQVAPNTIAFFGLGTSNTTSPLGSLPFPLDGIGASGCKLLIDPNVLQSLIFADPAGQASYTLSIPSDPIFTGLRVFAQCFAAAPGANPAGLTASPGLNLLIGNV